VELTAEVSAFPNAILYFFLHVIYYLHYVESCFPQEVIVADFLFYYITVIFHVQNFFAVTGKLWPKLYEIKLHPVKKHFDTGVIVQLCIPPRS
jgi:hypothetical protein